MVAIKGLTIEFLDDGPTLEKAGYIFYSGFKYGVNKNVQKRIKVNQFFFVRISRHDDPCIGELVSIWKDKYRDTMLSSVRLYFLPEQTPDGRQSNHGQHEVLAASEPVILRLNDLVSWITDEVDWVTGLEVPYSSNKIDPPAFTLPFLNLINKQITLGYPNCNPHPSHNHENGNDKKIHQHNNKIELQQQSNEESNQHPNSVQDKVKQSGDQQQQSTSSSSSSSTTTLTSSSSQINNNNNNNNDLIRVIDSQIENQSTIVVLSYPQYCRYRAVLKKMEENFKEKENISINGKVTKSTLSSLSASPSKHQQTLSTSSIVEPNKCKIYPNIRILFCRETFEHEGLLHHDLNCEHLAPKLKGRPRKRGGSSVTMNVSAAKTSSHSSSSQDSDTSEENNKQDSSRVRLPRKTSATTNKVKSHEVDCAFQGNRNNVTSKYKSTTSPMSAKLAEKCLKNETEFMKQLNKFMKERNTPITRIPHLGFKKIDLFYLFTLTQKLGGYERITQQRIWKIVYDRLGGDPRSTSAATCTRRHFERLLLPFERHLNEARGIKTNRRSTRGRSISPLGSPELSGGKGGSGEGLEDDQSIASGTSVVTEERRGRRKHGHRHHRHRHRRQGVRQSKRLQQGSSSSGTAPVPAASTNGSTSSATDDDESESLNSELHEEDASKSSIVDGRQNDCPVEPDLGKSEESQSGRSTTDCKVHKSSSSCSGDDISGLSSSKNGLQSRDEIEQGQETVGVESNDENERKSSTSPVRCKSIASPTGEDNSNCSQSERKLTSQILAVKVAGDEENMEIDKVSNVDTTDDVKCGSSLMVNSHDKDEVKNDANKDSNETKGDKIELKSVNTDLEGDVDMNPIKSEPDCKSADELSANEKVNCLKSNKCNADDTNNDKRSKNLTTGTDDCDNDDNNVEVDLNLSKSDKISTANGAVNVDTNNAASPLSSISTLISAMDAAKQQQQVHLTREMKVETNDGQTIPVNGIKKTSSNVKSNAVNATVNATVNNSLNVSLNTNSPNVTNTISGRPSVIHKTPLKPCVKVVPTYKDNPIDGLPKDNSLLKKPCLPPIAHAATFLPSPWYSQQLTSGSSSSPSVTKSTKLTGNFSSPSSLKRKVSPSSHQDSLLLPLDLTCKKRIVEVDRKVTSKDKLTTEDNSPSTILDLSAKVRVKECKSGKNSGLQVTHNSMDNNNNVNNNTNNSVHRSAHQHHAIINSVPKVPKSNNSNSNANSNSNSNSNSNINNNVNINVNYDRTTVKSNSSKSAVNHQTHNQQQQQRHINPSPLPVSSPVANTGPSSTPKHHSSSQSNHKTISNSNRSQLIKSSPSPNALKIKDKSNHSASSVTNSGSGLKDLNQQQQHLIQTHLNGLSNHQHHQRRQQQQQQQQQPLSSHHHQTQQQHQQLPLLPPGFPFSSSELSSANRDVQSKLQSANTLNQLRAMVTPENFALASQTIAHEIAFREMERLHPNLAKQMSSVLGYPAGFHPMLNSVHRPTMPSSPSISEYNPTLPSFLPFLNSFPNAAAAAASGTQTNTNGNGSEPNMNAMAAAAAAALASGHFFNPAMLAQPGAVSGFSPLQLLGDERFSAAAAAAAAAAAENDARWRGWFE